MLSCHSRTSTLSFCVLNTTLFTAANSPFLSSSCRQQQQPSTKLSSLTVRQDHHHHYHRVLNHCLNDTAITPSTKPHNNKQQQHQQQQQQQQQTRYGDRHTQDSAGGSYRPIYKFLPPAPQHPFQALYHQPPSHKTQVSSLQGSCYLHTFRQRGYHTNTYHVNCCCTTH